MATRDEIAKVLESYGLIIDDEFMERYETDGLVQVLTTVVLGQADATETVLKEAFEAGAKMAFDQLEAKLNEKLEKPI